MVQGSSSIPPATRRGPCLSMSGEETCSLMQLVSASEMIFQAFQIAAQRKALGNKVDFVERDNLTAVQCFARDSWEREVFPSRQKRHGAVRLGTPWRSLIQLLRPAIQRSSTSMIHVAFMVQIKFSNVPFPDFL